MTLGDLITLYREISTDNQAPYRFSNATGTIWANEAQVEACRRARLLIDSTSTWLSSAQLANSWLYDVDSRIIQVRRVKFANIENPLQLKSIADFDTQIPGWESHSAATPLYYVTDYQRNKLAIYPKLKTADTLSLTVVREPLAPMALLTDSPEIPSRYHDKLVHWMLYKYFQNYDADVNWEAKAAKHLGLFELEFGPARPALNEAFEHVNYDYRYDGAY